MRIDPVTEARREAWGITRIGTEAPLGPELEFAQRPVLIWDESLAASLDAASLAWFALEPEYGAVLGAQAISRAAFVLEAGNVRFLCDIPSASIFSPTKLEADLRRAFEREPVEDGIVHAAEEVIGEAVESQHHLEALECLQSLALDVRDPEFATSVLRCLARESRAGTADWRATLIQNALEASSLQMREAAVQAAETWGDGNAMPVLEAHTDADDWLRDYIQGVVDDLRT